MTDTVFLVTLNQRGNDSMTGAYTVGAFGDRKTAMTAARAALHATCSRAADYAEITTLNIDQTAFEYDRQLRPIRRPSRVLIDRHGGQVHKRVRH